MAHKFGDPVYVHEQLNQTRAYKQLEMAIVRMARDHGIAFTTESPYPVTETLLTSFWSWAFAINNRGILAGYTTTEIDLEFPAGVIGLADLLVDCGFLEVRPGAIAVNKQYARITAPKKNKD